MKHFSTMLCTAAVLSAGMLCAETKTFNTAEDWGLPGEIKEEKGMISVAKSMELCSEDFPVDLNKKYTFKFSAKASNLKKGASSLFLAGFKVLDKNNRHITQASIAVVYATDTEVVADVKKGDKIIKVKDGSKYQALGHAVIVFNSKPDRSDLPNFNTLAIGVGKAVKKGNIWEIPLTKGAQCDIKAGTKIREHVAGGYLYFANYRLKDQWVTHSVSFKGKAHPGTYGPNWPAGTARVQIVLLVNYGESAGVTTTLKDVSLTIE